jgi:hypothetical protein
MSAAGYDDLLHFLLYRNKDKEGLLKREAD